MARRGRRRAVTGVDSANRRQLLFAAVGREFSTARKSDCTVPGSGVTSPGGGLRVVGNRGLTSRQRGAQTECAFEPPDSRVNLRDLRAPGRGAFPPPTRQLRGQPPS